MTDKRKKKDISTDKQKSKRLKSDALFKRLMVDPKTAYEFLDYYLPEEFKHKLELDISKIVIEKESYVEDDLKHSLSDIVYSLKTKEGDKAYAYILLEHQSSNERLMVLRLWKYVLNLCDRHKNDKGKFPLVAPIVFYTGTKKYTAARNLWELFVDPQMAKKLLSEDHKLIDLSQMSDEEIAAKNYLGMLEMIMKHIHMRDAILVWEKLLKTFDKCIIFKDYDRGNLYLSAFLWYTDKILKEEEQPQLQKLIKTYLEDDGDKIMGTIAQKYIQEGKHIGLQEGEVIGLQRGKTEIAKNLLKAGISLDVISSSTGLSHAELKTLQATLSLGK